MGDNAKRELALKQKVQDLMEAGKQVTKSVQDLKKTYEKYKSLYERGKKLLDKDTRDAALFKEALNLLMKEAGNLIGEDLTKHPYFVINKPGIDALIDAIIASDTINNAREKLRDAEKELTKLKPEAAEYAAKSGSNEFHAQWNVVINLRDSKRGINWFEYVNRLNDEKFKGQTRAQALDEVENALKLAELLLEETRNDVDMALLIAFKDLQKYYALAAAGANIVLAEKAYEQKIKDLSDSSSTIKSGFGKLEQERRQNERGFDAVENRNGRGKSFAEQVASVMDDPNRAADDMRGLIFICLHPEKLLDLEVRGPYLPWEIPLPRA
jgi:hypothetical protein